MAENKKQTNHGKKFISVLLLLSLLVPVFFFAAPPQKADATIPVADVLDTLFHGGNFVNLLLNQIKTYILDGLARYTAQRMVQQITASTIKWVNSGFKGSPAFVTNPDQFFKNLGDQVAGDFIHNIGMDQICKPFLAGVKIAIQSRAGNPMFPQKAACTLSQAINSVKGWGNYVQGGFSQGGGWRTWFDVTQNPQNNPLGIGIMAQEEVGLQQSNAVATKAQDILNGKGFLSQTKCDKKDPATGQCLHTTVTTPGSVINDQLNQALPSQMQSLINVNQINELVGAVMNQLLLKTFGPGGLLGLGGQNAGKGSPIYNYQNESTGAQSAAASLTQAINKDLKTLSDPKYVAYKKASLVLLDQKETVWQSVYACYSAVTPSTSMTDNQLSDIQDSLDTVSTTLSEDIPDARAQIISDLNDVDPNSSSSTIAQLKNILALIKKGQINDLPPSCVQVVSGGASKWKITGDPTGNTYGSQSECDDVLSAIPDASGMTIQGASSLYQNLVSAGKTTVNAQAALSERNSLKDDIRSAKQELTQCNAAH